MARMIRRRVALGVLTLVIVSVLIFLIIHNIPGDPIGVLLQQNRSPDVRRVLERYYGLDRPLVTQYLSWIGHLFHGNMGSSIITGQPVGGLLIERFVRTLYLMIGAMVLAIVVALPLGVWSAARKGRASDVAITSVAIGLQSLPEFWIGMLLVLLFGVELHMLPTSGFVSPGDSLGGFFQHAIMPVVAIGAILTGLLVRTLRATLLEQLRQDYVTTALAQGVSYRRVVTVHALRNSLIPTLTLIGLQIGILLGGTVIVEKVFDYPGMGQLLVTAMSQRDYPVIQGALLLFAGSFVLINLATDVIAMALNPRNREAVRAA